jgi:cyclase
MHSTVRISLGTLLAAGSLAAQANSPPSVDSKVRTAARVADGIYVIHHADAPNGYPQGNTTVVVGGRSVLVVDAPYLPSSAREDIAQIATWTSKPVQYLVNTHWHFDHTFGNGAYAAAFPGLTIVSHRGTPVQMRGWNASWREGFSQRSVELKGRLDRNVDAAGKPLAPADRARLETQVGIRDRIWSEFASYAVPLPTLAFDAELELDLGNRVVRLLHLGRGNTDGDAVVHVPDARVVATGDLLAHPVPYLAGGHPSELVRALKAIDTMDVAIIVPGHGAVLRDKSYLREVAEFVELVVGQVNRDFFRLGTSWTNVDQVQASVTAGIDLPRWRSRFTHGDARNGSFFDGFTFPGLIQAAYAEAWGR